MTQIKTTDLAELEVIVDKAYGPLNLMVQSEIDSYVQIANDALHISRDRHGTNIDTLVCLFKKGPCYDGDVPAKSERDWLLDNGYCEKVVVKKEQGYNAMTYKGYVLLKFLVQLTGRTDFVE